MGINDVEIVPTTMDGAPGVIVHDGNPPHPDLDDGGFGKEYFSIRYQPGYMDHPDGSPTSKGFQLDGEGVTPEIVEEIQKELSGR